MTTLACLCVGFILGAALYAAGVCPLVSACIGCLPLVADIAVRARLDP